MTYEIVFAFTSLDGIEIMPDVHVSKFAMAHLTADEYGTLHRIGKDLAERMSKERRGHYERIGVLGKKTEPADSGDCSN